MKGFKLIRRLEQADLIRWFPEPGKPVVTAEGDRLRRTWTELTRTEWVGETLHFYKGPPGEEVHTGCYSRKFWEILTNA